MAALLSDILANGKRKNERPGRAGTSFVALGPGHAGNTVLSVSVGRWNWPGIQRCRRHAICAPAIATCSTALTHAVVPRLFRPVNNNEPPAPMNAFRNLLISLVFLLVVGEGRASEPRQYRLTMNALVASTGGSLDGAHALLFVGGQLMDSTSLEDGGFTLDLPTGMDAVLEVRMPGHITKQVVLATAGLTHDQRFDCDILLFPGNGMVERAGRITCDPATGGVIVVHDPRTTGSAAQAVARP